MENPKRTNENSKLEREAERFLLDEAGNKVPLSAIKVGTRLKFLGDPNFAHGNPDPEYLDDNAPTKDEVRTVEDILYDTGYLRLAPTQNLDKGVCYIELDTAKISSRIIG